MTVADKILQIFAERGEAAYFGEAVSQSEHALQAAHLAEQEGAAPALVVAALLHDIGHLIHGMDENIADQGIDARHEEAGQVWLARYFGPEVTEPVRLHVAAKRYLCTTDLNYLAALSPASVRSLALQGGPFSDSEVAEFEKSPFFREAVRLRRWDDTAKVPKLPVPGLEHYLTAISDTTKG